MKKFLLFGFALIVFNGAFAQFNKGRMLASGSVSFSSSTQKFTNNGVTTTAGTQTDFSFGPGFGYFVADNIAVGAELVWGSSKSSPNGIASTTNSSIAFAPFARYYLESGLFGEGTIGFGSVKAESGNVSQKESLSLWGLGIGYAYFLNDHVAIEPVVQYQSRSTKDDVNGGKYTDAGLAINVKLGIYLGERK